MTNAGIVTESATAIDTTRLHSYFGGNTSLVAQGGGQRGIFTAGVLDAFLYSDFDPFDTYYGTSAGALNLCAYLCRQAGLGRSFLLELTTQPEFFSLFGYIRNQQTLDIDWALDKVCQYPYKLDVDLGRQQLQGKQAFASVTDAVHLQDHYLPMLRDNWVDVLKATCAIPRLYKGEVVIDGVRYLDGGVSASVPVQQAWRMGGRMIVVIRTEPFEQQSAVEDVPDSENAMPVWLRQSVDALQNQWDTKVLEWKSDWADFLLEKFNQSGLNRTHKAQPRLLNGGRWLFGAGDVYRLSHMLGETFDSGLADMLMVHYQTYSLTQQFLTSPPDDCFVVQIHPEAPLESTSLLSDREALLSDYELGLKAGSRFIETYLEAEASQNPRSA
ncbi:putative Acyl transferase/acyl hydrolase/lysophospholipase [Vibrio nigripulchritudo SO65]|uniref:patatin-like phospholipase family protein n=1 Tax=Vibrio nigripulchritudo TaxID=28173 RepID=UPI0003B1FF3E|nr:patatin-like phospholipase family protein [Vibrio nigripulchritudo]CCN36684.1 putative Acyl transferase/acyl hydrolase/lysophospholipase [Vibrio nigripulchritudo AM115]CCN42510.1 putative Acyl transferase/acyl hydrolase/lysophospholipase [Vibrio nigripulchritudo FTn2]CCN63819.1 putative Acyl transferase/acyl hydrolase/lysophospholipase [Vibrio nigripulchritudo POn4]CCN78844.1 putative Acyl transferase/acyl hydrolase/lysophospholipase [Vibrio nigripulchritudo SO65]